MFSGSFVPVGQKHGKGIGVLWHEGVAGRSAAEISSTFIDCYDRRGSGTSRVTLWADNCSGQNKNWWLFGALVKEVNKVGGDLDVITLKFFEPGHTFMSADSFHALIEKGIKKKNKIQDFQDLADVVNSKGEALVSNYNDFYHVQKQLTTAMYAAGKAYLDDVQVAQFERGSVKLIWKKTCNYEEFKSAYFLQKKAEKDVKNLFTLFTLKMNIYRFKFAR